MSTSITLIKKIYTGLYYNKNLNGKNKIYIIINGKRINVDVKRLDYVAEKMEDLSGCFAIVKTICEQYRGEYKEQFYLNIEEILEVRNAIEAKDPNIIDNIMYEAKQHYYYAKSNKELKRFVLGEDGEIERFLEATKGITLETNVEYEISVY